jgi:hypothetical protein
MPLRHHHGCDRGKEGKRRGQLAGKSQNVRTILSAAGTPSVPAPLGDIEDARLDKVARDV